MVNRKAMDADDIEVFAYGLDMLLSTLVNAAFILCVAAIFGIFTESLIFYCVFSAIQTMGGGFHASTHFRCFCVTVSGWAVSMLIMSAASLPVMLLLAAWGVVSIIVFAPIEHENAPMSDSKKVKMKRYVRILMCLVVVIAMAIYALHSPLYMPLLAALGAVGASMTSAAARKYVQK